jgi:hypothetical protein
MLYLKLWFIVGVFCWLSEFPDFWGHIREEAPEDRLSLALILSAFAFFCWPMVLYFWIRRVSYIFCPPKKAGATDPGTGR